MPFNPFVTRKNDKNERLKILEVSWNETPKGLRTECELRFLENWMGPLTTNTRVLAQGVSLANDNLFPYLYVRFSKSIFFFLIWRMLNFCLRQKNKLIEHLLFLDRSCWIKWNVIKKETLAWLVEQEERWPFIVENGFTKFEERSRSAMYSCPIRSRCFFFYRQVKDKCYNLKWKTPFVI